MNLLDKKLYENFLIYDIAYKTPYGAKPLHIIFDIVDGYVRKYDGTKYLAVFHSGEIYETVADKVPFGTFTPFESSG